MYMVRHQTVSHHLDAGSSAPFREQRSVCTIIVVAEERRHAAVATLGDVVRQAGNDNASGTRHTDKPTSERRSDQEQNKNIPNPNAPVGSPFQYVAPEGAAKTMSAVLGEIVWLMSQSQIHKSFFISDLEWFVMAPVFLKQFRLFYDKDKPIGVVFWGRVSDEVEQRLAQAPRSFVRRTGPVATLPH